ncbi:hypothetical protein ACN26Z_21545 [Verrucosispora sp. WMMD703]|uniref:hypothetical protein n=1 Tax=Verrucosispora sp. WMMD703 TaxID=3403463 RepID=UPI003B94F981
MGHEFDDRRARVLVALVAVLAMLFLVAASSVAGTFWFRNGTHSDGQVVSALALDVVRGRQGEAKVEYFVDAKRYEAWVYCGTSCPNEGDRMEVEYSASDPTEVVRNRARTYSPLAVGVLILTALGIVLCISLLRRAMATQSR